MWFFLCIAAASVTHFFVLLLLLLFQSIDLAKMYRSSMSISINLIILVVIITLSATIDAQKLKCNSKTEKEMDQIVARIMTFGTDRPFPADKAKLKEYCK